MRLLPTETAESSDSPLANRGEGASRAAGLEEEITTFLRDYVNSPVKLDLLLYLHDNPFAVDGADVLAMRLGREQRLVEECAATLVRAGVLVPIPGNWPGTLPCRLAETPWVRERVARLAQLHQEGRAPEIRSAIRDIVIAETVRNTLAESERVSLRAVSIGCQSGWVVLDGRVNTATERAEMQVICQQLQESRHGIRGFTNRVIVEPCPASDDEEIRGRVESRLATECALKAAQRREGGERAYVQVEVVGGVVYLAGLVLSPQDRVSAARVAKDTPGAEDVVNWLDVEKQRGR